MPRYAMNSPKIRELIQKRENFQSYAAFEGYRYPNDFRVYHGNGWNNGSAVAQLEKDCLSRKVDYVIVSFATPIAWHHKEYGWRVVSRNFSSRTARHQSAVESALWGLTGPENQILRLQRGYSVSEPQKALLQECAWLGLIGIKGQARRSAVALQKMGLMHLITFDANPGQLVGQCSTAGRDFILDRVPESYTNGLFRRNELEG